MAVDKRHKFIYITDNGYFGLRDNYTINAAIIAVDYSQVPYRVHRFLSAAKVTGDDFSLWLEINGYRVKDDHQLRAGAKGIAYNPFKDNLVWSSINSHNIYEVRASYFRDFSNSDEKIIKATLPFMTGKQYASDGIVFGINEHLYATSLENSAIYKIHKDREAMLASNLETMHWPSSFTFDHFNSIIFLSNQYDNFLNHRINFDDFTTPKYFIQSLFVGTQSYIDAVDQQSEPEPHHSPMVAQE